MQKGSLFVWRLLNPKPDFLPVVTVIAIKTDPFNISNEVYEQPHATTKENFPICNITFDVGEYN